MIQNNYMKELARKLPLLLHEGSTNDTLISNFRYQDIGEILYLYNSFMAFALLIIFLICFKLSNSFESTYLIKIFYFLIIFGIFAIVIDSIHKLLSRKIYD